MAECGVAFRVALPKSSRFSSRASRQNTGGLHVPVWYRPMSVEAVGFELGVWPSGFDQAPAELSAIDLHRSPVLL
jgi:hypothetical protein